MKNTLDLNLYRFIDLLYRQQSLAKVTHTLSISRATFNRQLSECRERFGNELFIANKGIYQPTLFTSQLVSSFKLPLEQLEQVQQLSHSFDTNKLDIEFIICVSSSLSSLITLPTIKRINATHESPKISFVDWSLDSIEHPKADSLSIGVSGYPNELNDSIIERQVGSLPLFAFMPTNHPQAIKPEICLSDLKDCNNVRVSMGALDDSSYYEAIKRKTGISLQQKLTVTSIEAALQCLEFGHYVFVSFDIDSSQVPCNVAKIPLTLKGEQLHYDVGMQFHRAYYQHPIIKQFERLLSDTLKLNQR